MKHAETVTFGGSGLDRAAELRGDHQAIDFAITDGQADALLLWRGKPLVAAPGLDRLVRLPPDHPVLALAEMPPIFLGREETGRLVLAYDISSWMPDGLDEAQIGAFVDASEQQHPDLPEDTAFAELRRIMTRLSARDAELAATGKAPGCCHAVPSRR